MKSLEAKLQEIKARAEAATPGPWVYEFGSVISHATEAGLGVGKSSVDMDFIANARQDIPALLRLIEVLREQRNRGLKLLYAAKASEHYAAIEQQERVEIEAMLKENL